VNLVHNASHSTSTLSTVQASHSLAAPVKVNGNNFHLRVSCDMPEIFKHEHTCSKSHKCEYGFSFALPEKVHS